MKKICVIVKEKTILELAEDGLKGDLIDLKELVEVDTSYIDNIIKSGKDEVYNSNLEQVKKTLIAENKLEINKLKNEIESLKKQYESDLKLNSQSIENKHLEEKNNLRNELESLKTSHQLEIVKHENQIKQIELENENKFNVKLKEESSKYELEIEKMKSQIENLTTSCENDKLKALSEQKEKFDEEIKAKEEIINNLQRAKISMNIKQTGENLESWCDNEVVSYMQNGLFNCVWFKDNKVIKDDNENHGSKADYIFKIYANELHNENELLASVCMDMKDENPNSVNKKNNSDYYKQLDKNREKKNCKYAVLVSNLEMDKPNILPIFKVREYENMYVVRPAYLMVFLNLITSLTVRFANLVQSEKREMVELKTRLDLINIFDDIKKTYLDKPLESLEKNVETIQKNSETIKKACENIYEQCDKINKSYISQIAEKINKFELKLSKDVTNKLE